MEVLFIIIIFLILFIVVDARLILKSRRKKEKSLAKKLESHLENWPKESEEINKQARKKLEALEIKKQKKAQELLLRESLALQSEKEALKLREKEIKEKALHDNIKRKIKDLEDNLPFYISDRLPSEELSNIDKKQWEFVYSTIYSNDQKSTELYLVKILSLYDDEEYYKIGVTSKGVNVRFERSTQVELLEVLATFKTKKWIAVFLEYHFLREFRLYEGLTNTLVDSKPSAKFSGYTEVVRSNSIEKILRYFSKLDTFNSF